MPNPSVPLYQQIIDELKRQIKQGLFDGQKPLPNQIDLARQFNTSEITSRRALTELVNEGLIYRIRGKGTFVKERGADPIQRTRTQGIERIYFAFPKLQLNTLNNRFFSDLLAGMNEVCEEFGVELTLWNIESTGGLPEADQGAVVLLNPMQGSNSLSPEKLGEWKDERRRLMTVHVYYPHLQIPYAIVDNLTGGYLATQHLIGLGHRRIGLVLTGHSFHDLNQEFSLRLQGYKIALEQNRIPFEESLVCIVPGDRESDTMGAFGAKTLMELAEPPTAIFATSDYKAIGAIQALHELGKKVPDDISVIGYDDEMISEYTLPRLTTVSQNSRKLGRRAAEILLLEWGTGFVKDEIVPSLVIRDTTAPPPEQDGQSE